MSRITNLSQSLCLIITVFTTSCLDQKQLAPNKHGMNLYNKSSFSYMGLVERSIQLKLKSDINDVSTIYATIETEFDYNYPIQFRWRLGEFVRVKDQKSLVGQIPNLKKNTPVTLELEVLGFDPNFARFVRFEAFGSNPSNKIFADGVLSSQLDKSFESLVKEVELYKKQQGAK